MLRRSVNKRRLFFSRICLAFAVFMLTGCVTSSTTQRSSQETGPATIEAVEVNSFGGEMTVIEVLNSKYAPHTAFKLIDPPRIVLDIRAVPGADLPPFTQVNDGNIKDIRVEKGKAQALTTRVIFELATAGEHSVVEKGKVITVSFRPVKAEPEKVASEVRPEKEGAGLEETRPSEPRIFFKQRPIDLNQVLGIDFSMLDRGKSRLSITTAKKARYNLERTGPKELALVLEDASVPQILLRRLDSSNFEGAVDRVKSAFSENRLSLAISLREMVPFHVDQTDSAIQVDFGSTSLRPPERVLVPVKQAVQEPMATTSSSQPPAGVAKIGGSSGSIPQLSGGGYTGAPMTMDFVNADVTNILRLIGEISNLNIIWGPEVKGTVSMRLKNVPWDQALDLVLANNDLGMRREGNVIWVTTRAKISQIEAEERRRQLELEKQAAAERQKVVEEKKEAKEQEPLLTEYLAVDFAEAEEIKTHIILSDRGKISIDTRTNTIIMTDIASSLEVAKRTVKRFDTPVKQIMIEARIVDATTNFTRDLGVKWGSISGERRSNTGVSYGMPTDATTYTAGNDTLYGGSFSTNSPTGWAGNMAFTLGWLTSSQLGALTLDASLAVAESEGDAKVISAPKVIAREGTAASISRGDSIIIPATENVASTTLDATLSLTVTPSAVSVNDFITLEIEVTDDQAPSTSRLLKKALSTTLMVRSGDTVVLGGIYKESKGDDESGIPWLRDIPVLGYLFKAQRKTSEKSELLIFLTPTVLPTPAKKNI